MNAEEAGIQSPSFVDFFLKVTGSNRRGRSASVSRQRVYTVLARSNLGEVQASTRLPFDHHELENTLLKVENALITSGPTARRIMTSGRQAVVEAFGTTLFDTLLPNEVLELYNRTRLIADRDGNGVRLRLRIEPPELAAIPWEFIFDARHRAYIGLSSNTPIVRDIGLNQPIRPVAVEPPLRVLGMISSPQAEGLEQLDVEHERRRVEDALQGLREAGLIDLRWMRGTSWRDLSEEIRRGAFNVFHFVGHGGFDSGRDEGLIALTDDAGNPYYLPATELGMLLANERALRLVVLNSCDGARGSTLDVFSSTASILVHRGVTAVVAMQYEITDDAAVEFSRTFYEAIADGEPIDAAVGHGRMAIRLGVPGSLEWATPVLYQRAPDGVLFKLAGAPRPKVRSTAEADDEPEQATPVASPEAVNNGPPTPVPTAQPTSPELVGNVPDTNTPPLSAGAKAGREATGLVAEEPERDLSDEPGQERGIRLAGAHGPRLTASWLSRLSTPRLGSILVAIASACLFVAIAVTTTWAIAGAAAAMAVALAVGLWTNRSTTSYPDDAPSSTQYATLAATCCIAVGAGAVLSAALASAPLVSEFDTVLGARPAHQHVALALAGAGMALAGLGLLRRPRWLWRRYGTGYGGTFGIFVGATVAMLPFWAPEPVLQVAPAIAACDPSAAELPTQATDRNGPETSDVTMFRGNLSRTGLTAAVATDPLEVRLLAGAKDQVWSSAVWSDGTIFIGSNDGLLHAIDLETGQPLDGWPFDTRGRVYSSPVVADGVVYFGSSYSPGGEVHAVDLATGQELEGWPVHTSSTDVYASPVVVNGTVYVGAIDGHFYKIDAKSGEYRRYISEGSAIWSTAAIADNVAIVGTTGNSVIALGLDDGKVRWTFPTAGPVMSSPAVANGTVYVGSDDGCIYALDAEDGTERWRFQTGEKVFSSPAIANGIVYAGSKDSNLYALEADTGNEVWRFDTGGMIWSSPAVSSGAVYFGSDDGHLYAVDARTKEGLGRADIDRREIELPAHHNIPQMRSSPLVLGERVVIGSLDGNVYLITPHSTNQPPVGTGAALATPPAGATPVD